MGLELIIQVVAALEIHPEPVRRSREPSDPRIQFVAVGLVSGEELQGVFIGDYSAVALGFDLRLHPCWTDFRGRP